MARVDADTTRFWFHGPDFDGKEADLRVDVTRLNPDLYRWSVAEKVEASWKELASLEYRRLPGS